jgi:hypothetical protein
VMALPQVPTAARAGQTSRSSPVHPLIGELHEAVPVRSRDNTGAVRQPPTPRPGAHRTPPMPCPSRAGRAEWLRSVGATQLAS